MSFITYQKLDWVDYTSGNPYGREWSTIVHGYDIPGAKSIGNEVPWIICRVYRANSSRIWHASTSGYINLSGSGYTREDAVEDLLLNIATKGGE